MSQPAKAGLSTVSLATPIVLYGLDADDKPQAARFPERQCDLALKAAEQLKLNVLKVTTDEIAQIAGRLPVGRINASGRGLVPLVRQPLYDQILAVAKVADSSGVAASSNAPNGLTKIPLNEARRDGNPVGSKACRPAGKTSARITWCWFKRPCATAGGKPLLSNGSDDMLTVRWRDYPKWKPFVVHADAVGLLNGSPSFKA